MKKIIFIQPRQTGKSTAAIYEYTKNPNSSLIVCFNIDSANRISNLIGGEIKNVISSESLGGVLAGYKRFDTIILDEYLFFKDLKKVYNLIKEYEPNNLLVFSTAKKKYYEKAFKYVKQHKGSMRIEDIKINLQTTLSKDVEELYYNFLTDEDSIIIDHVFNKDTLISLINRRHDFMQLLDPESFDIEFNNVYIKK